jgi:hypothetical protein
MRKGAVAGMDKKAGSILQYDIDLIRNALSDFENYDFAADVESRMKKLNLTPNALAGRLDVSHVIVGKWLARGARPHGKERMKELGMALGMNRDELDEFLYSNGYPRLYAKSPLDDVCKLALKNFSGKENIVQLYKDNLALYGLTSYAIDSNRVNILTDDLSRNFNNMTSKQDFGKWLEQHRQYFSASAKSVIPNERLIRLIMLYVGEDNINRLYKNAELPKAIRNLLYPLLGEKEVAIRGLRNKLIVFGLYSNMTEDEIDFMLSCANLLPITEPKTALDMVLLTLIRCAHERYPYYEYDNVETMLLQISSAIGNASTEEEKNALRELHALFVNRQQAAEANALYYDKHKGEEERLFEELYTDCAEDSDARIINYAHDMLTLLAAKNILSEQDAEDILHLI